MALERINANSFFRDALMGHVTGLAGDVDTFADNTVVDPASGEGDGDVGRGNARIHVGMYGLQPS